MMLAGVIAPYVGRGLLASFSAVKYIVESTDVDEENYTDENMTQGKSGEDRGRD